MHPIMRQPGLKRDSATACSMAAIRETQVFRNELLTRERFRITDSDSRVRGHIAARIRDQWYAPEFQFDGNGTLLPGVDQLARELSRLGEQDDGGWSAIFWLFQPHSRLAGDTPAESFSTRPYDVIEAAAADVQGVRYEGT